MRSRRIEYSESTRSALVASAVELFTKRGYSGTALDEIAKRARVTKGALYHHFTGKLALFEAAFDAVEHSVVARLAKIVESPGDPWELAMKAVRAYIKVCFEPAYQRIVIDEGPVVMGWERWSEVESHYGFGLVRSTVESLVTSSLLPSLPIDITAQLLFGTLASAAKMIAHASDPKRVGAEVADTIEQVLQRLRLTSGVPEHAGDIGTDADTGEPAERAEHGERVESSQQRRGDKRAKRSA